MKPITPIISIPLCTTSSTLHLLAFLESTVPSLPPPSWTFLVIFLLSPVGAVGRDIEPSSRSSNTHQSLNHVATTVGDTKDESSPAVSNDYNILRSQQLKLLSCGASVVNSATSSVAIMHTYSSSCVLPNNNPSSSNTFGTVFDGRTGTTTILRLRQLKLLSYSTASNTVQAIVATIFVALTVTLLRLMLSYVTTILQSKRIKLYFDTVIALIVAIATTVSDNNDNATDATIFIDCTATSTVYCTQWNNK